MYNKTIIAGNLGRDPELRYTPSGQAVTNLSVAVNEVWSDSDGEKQERTHWFRVAVWGKQAENCTQYLAKGAPVLIEGRINSDPTTGGPRIYERTDGTLGAQHEITAQVVKFLPRNGGSSNGSTEPASVPAAEEESEIPF